MDKLNIQIFGFPYTYDNQFELSNILPQIVQISKLNSGFFLEETATKAIPEDAKKNLCLVGILPTGDVASFCIAKISYYEVEILWLATHPEHFRKGCARKLLKKLENITKNHFSQIQSIYVKLTIPNCFMREEKIASGNWSDTAKFYNACGFLFQYGLYDYWYLGNHAAIFAKRLGKQFFGYTNFDFKNLCTYRTSGFLDYSNNHHQRINQDLQDGIRKHLRLFHNIAEHLNDPIEKAYGAIEKKRGIVGLAFFPSQTSNVTLFANTTDKLPKNTNIDYLFEFPIEENILTRILSNKKLPNTGVVIYERDWDEMSINIKLDQAFKSFVSPYKSHCHYALFYHRYYPNNSVNRFPMSCFYYYIPAPKNVVAYKHSWEGFTQYSFSLLQDIYDAIRTLYSTRYQGNLYLKNLMDCCKPISPELESLEKKGEQLWEKKGHHQFFHTIKHKLSDIDKFLHSDINIEVINEDKHGDYSQAKILLQQLYDELEAIYRIDSGYGLKFSTISLNNIMDEHKKYAKEYTMLLKRIYKPAILNEPYTKLPLSTQIQYSPKLFQILLFEVFHNLRLHASDVNSSTFCYCSLNDGNRQKWLTLQVTNLAEENAFENIKTGELFDSHRNQRMKGLGVVELIQEYVGCPFWDVRVLDCSKKSVKFRYPFAKLIKTLEND